MTSSNFFTAQIFPIDFFTLTLKSKKPLSYRDDIRELMAVAKTLSDRLIGGKCSDSKNVQNYFNKYIKTLPDSRAMWRFKLYALGLCPDTFANELRAVYFRIFETNKYYEIMSGTEYEKTLEKGFHTLSVPDKDLYVDQLIKYFVGKTDENPQEKWHMRHGSELLTVIKNQLTDVQKAKVNDSGFIFIENYEPSTSISETMGGMVRTRRPINQDEYNKKPLEEIANKLRDE